MPWTLKWKHLLPWTWFSKKRCSKEGSQPPKRTNEPKFKQMEKILKELECPICFSTCIPPIYTCQNGHIICSNCRQNITACPSCRERLGGTRNFFAEHFIAQYSQPCKYARDGCVFLKWKGEDMKSHERHCFYRPIPCIVPSCSNAIRYKFLLEHIMDTHKIYGSESLPVCVSYHTDDPLIADRKWLPYYIKAFNTNFFLMLEVIRPHFWAWVWVQTAKKDSSNSTVFIASLRFHNAEKNLSLEWKGPVYSIRTPSAMITQEGLCFGGAETLLQHFEIDGLIRLVVNIEKQTLCSSANNSNGTEFDDASCLATTRQMEDPVLNQFEMEKSASKSVSVVSCIREKQCNRSDHQMR